MITINITECYGFRETLPVFSRGLEVRTILYPGSLPGNRNIDLLPESAKQVWWQFPGSPQQGSPVGYSPIGSLHKVSETFTVK